ncbi:MAG: SCO family protein [Anaerolineales bacterium]|nr:SCO family protein [Anaerolineales bacterium]
MKGKTVLVIGLLVLVGVLAVFVAVQITNANYQYQGSLIDPPAPAFDIALQDTDGDLFQLSDHTGEVVLIFFGYTNCPDVCPTTLAEFKQVYENLGPDADRVKFVYFSVDPERDTQERVGEFVNAFNPNFIGITGDEADLEPVWQAYGVYHEKQEVGSAAGYVVDHTASVYVIDTQGGWRMTFPYGLSVDAMVQDIQHLLEEEG